MPLLSRRLKGACAATSSVITRLALSSPQIGLYGIFKTETFATQAFINPWGGPDEQVRRVVPFTVVPNRLAYANWKLAVVPGTPDLAPVVAQFMSDMNTRYPAFNGTIAASVNGTVRVPALASFNAPSFANVSMMFPSEAALSDYIAQPDYGLNSQPKVWAAIVFNIARPGSGAGVTAGGAFDISYRFNYTEVPDTRTPATNNLQRGYQSSVIEKYIYSVPQAPGSGSPVGSRPTYDPILYSKMPGFMTLQLMVDRWVINRSTPGAAATMDMQAALYAFSVSLGYAAPGGLQPRFLAQMAALQTADPVAAAIIASRVTAHMSLSEAWAPQTVDVVPFPITTYKNNGFYRIAGQVRNSQQLRPPPLRLVHYSPWMLLACRADYSPLISLPH